jgi:hypothetical protein
MNKLPLNRKIADRNETNCKNWPRIITARRVGRIVIKNSSCAARCSPPG